MQNFFIPKAEGGAGVSKVGRGDLITVSLKRKKEGRREKYRLHI